MAKDSIWIRKLARLRSMSWPEFEDRARQNVTARLDARRFSRGHNFAESVQDVDSAGKFFFERGELAALIVDLKRILPRQADQIVERAEQACQHRFDLLGYRSLDYGSAISWHLDAVHGKTAPRKTWFQIHYLDFDEVGDSKVTWDLNRHQHLVTLAKAYHLTSDRRFADECVAQARHWQTQNPYPIGINWASSLEVAFRTLSWIWTYFLLRDSEPFTPEVRREWLRQLSVSGRHIETYISTYFSPNTHLLGEALALFFLGVLFPQFSSAARWRERGWQILLQESARQVRADGFYFEQSTYYHVYALDMLLHACILAAANAVEIPLTFDDRLRQMLDALMLLSRAGLPATMGDDDGGRLFDPRRNHAHDLLDPLSTGAALYRRGDYKFLAGGLREETLWLLGRQGVASFESLETVAPRSDSIPLRDSGLYLMADAKLGQQLFIDAGPHGPHTGGHGHADALSVSAVGAGRVLLGDAGTFEYIGETGERERLRGTGAHNTVRVDGLDQAQPTGPFSWSQLPNVKCENWVPGRTFDLFVGSHDGYARLEPSLRHRRWVFHCKGKFWLIRDLVEGSGLHRLEITWNLGATLKPSAAIATGDDRFVDNEGQLLLAVPEAHGWLKSIHKDTWSPAYGEQERRTCVRFEREAQLPAEFATVVMAGESLPEVKLSSLGVSAEVAAYRLSMLSEEHYFFFASTSRAWALAGWASDADFLYCTRSLDREETTIVAVNGCFVERDNRKILNCVRRAGYVEALIGAGKTEVLSSDPSVVTLIQTNERGASDLEPAGRGKG
jgi:Heparinase II/III N-terminus/Heparinase II/III-like protein